MKRAVYVLITIISIGFMIPVLGFLVRPTSCDAIFSTAKELHSLPEDSLDIIIYGSSHSWRGINPNILTYRYGLNTFNYSYAWQKINTTASFIYDSMETQSPDYAVVDCAFVDVPLIDENMSGEIYSTRALGDYAYRDKYLKQCFGDNKERYLSYFVPLYGFHERWSQIDQDSFIFDNDLVHGWRKRGFLYKVSQNPINLKESKEENEELSAVSIDILNDIVKVCRENGTKLIFVVLPYVGVYRSDKALMRFAKENDCEYINFFRILDEVGIDERTDFYDEAHLNKYGAEKISDYLGRYITEYLN